MNVPYTSPAVLGEGFAKGIEMYNQSQQAALNRNQALHAKLQYEKAMEFIPLDKIAKGIPPDLQEPILKIAEGGGYIKEINGVNGVHKYQLQNFMKDFARNKLWQATVLEEASNMIAERLEPAKQEYQQLQAQVQSDLAEYQGRIKDIKGREAKLGYPLNSQIRKIEEEMRQYQTTSPAFAKMKQLESDIMKATELHLKRINALGMIETGYENDTKKYGRENALKLYQGMVSREALDYNLERQKQRAKYEEIENIERMKQAGATTRAGMRNNSTRGLPPVGQWEEEQPNFLSRAVRSVFGGKPKDEGEEIDTKEIDINRYLK